MEILKKEKIIIITCVFLFLCGISVQAASLNDSLLFNIDSSYDATARNNIEATLVKTSQNLYFYVEKKWWNSQFQAKQIEILDNLEFLSQEFNSRIYPILTSVFGSEWKPGVDGDSKITVLFHVMKDGAGGYFRTDDEYVKIQVPDSNEREMVYLPVSKTDNTYQLKTLLAHELVHLITFNQKDKANNIDEEVWLNEARAEYSATILGYNDLYSRSILQERVRDFLDSPTDSLTEWQETKYDYGVINLFIHYLVDHYSINILTNSLKLKSIGINSINEALLKNGFEDEFSEIFTNWTISILINNCDLGERYCYLNTNLKNIRLAPALNFLPISGISSLSVTNITKNWAGNWQKIFGGNGKLTLEFNSLKGLNFKVPYLIQNKDGSSLLNFLSLDNDQKGEFSISNFGDQSTSVIIIPSLQTKISGFDGNEFTYPYTFTISASDGKIIPDNSNQNNPLIPQNFTFQNNLYFGRLNQDVVYLKIMLASEGCVSGLTNTTYFGVKTLEAVKCFQNKYKAEISAAAGYPISITGFVGRGTRVKLNALLTGI